MVEGPCVKIKSAGTLHLLVCAHAMEKVVAVASDAITDPTMSC